MRTKVIIFGLNFKIICCNCPFLTMTIERMPNTKGVLNFLGEVKFRAYIYIALKTDTFCNFCFKHCQAVAVAVAVDFFYV